jgi:hypothetical protein
MANTQSVDPKLRQELFLLERNAAVDRVNEVLDGKNRELCLRTRYPKELDSFIAACLAARGELDSGAGERCLFVRNRATWHRLAETEQSPRILVAHAEVDFETHREELLQIARSRDHAVIYATPNPRPDTPNVIELPQPRKFAVQEVLKKHEFAESDAERLAQRSNGNVYLLDRLLSGTMERSTWAAGDVGYRLRGLALLGGWRDDSEKDRLAVGEIVGEQYSNWIERVNPLTRQEEPPVYAQAAIFRPVSRYETWQQLGHYLTDTDLRRFESTAVAILRETEFQLELPKEERQYAVHRRNTPEAHSRSLRKGLAETLALLRSEASGLTTTANLAPYVAESVAMQLLQNATWKIWATLDDVLPLIAEAAPDVFLSAVSSDLSRHQDSELRRVFKASESPLLGRTYHNGLLWALEVLAWHEHYLSRVAVCLAQLAEFPLPQNVANHPLNSLRSIFLTWLPQTLASVEQRRAAVKKVVDDHPGVGWKLLLALLPSGHDTGSYNPKPVWTDWFDKGWTGTITRHEMVRQVTNYAQLAVKAAVEDVNRLDQLIERWDHLPREAVDEILKYLTDPAFVRRPESERFVVWERLVDEVEKHRKYKHTDWAMPEEELLRLEGAAAKIEPQSVSVRHQRLFDDHDHHFFKSENYDLEREKLSKAREKAVTDMIRQSGLEGVIAIAGRVKIPGELGEALGRIGDEATDRFLLPSHLLTEQLAIINLVRGYVWGRYFAATARWAETIDVREWSIGEKATFFSFMPFQAPVWRRAEQVLGPETSEYWKRIYPNTFQARDDLEEAVTKAIEYKRGDIAVSGINSLRFNKRSFPIALALSAVKTLLADYQKTDRIDQHELIETIQLLQKSDEISIDEVSRIEFQCLRLLDRFSGAAPITLEKRLATDPKFFHETVTKAFRSEDAPEKKTATASEQKIAGQVFRLLYHWQTPPGTIDNKNIDDTLLKRWIEQTEKLCKKSGHWKIAQQLIGASFVYAPLGVEGLLEHPTAAEILDKSDSEEMRRGFTIALFNLRGVHGYSGGKDERKLAETYTEFAAKFDLSGFVQIAAALRGLAEGYRRDAERETKDNPYEMR